MICFLNYTNKKEVFQEMNEVINEFAQMSRQRPSQLRESKKEGEKVVEYIGNFIPEELIYAAGAKPYLMCRGGEPEPTEAILDNMLKFMNPLAKSIAGYQILGLDPITPITDLIVAQQVDCHIGRISELLEYMKLPVYKVGIPLDWTKDFAAEYYYNSLLKLKKKLEELTGNEISDDKLKEQIDYSNQINKLLRKIDKLREKSNPPIGGFEFIQLNHFSFYTEPKVAIEKLNEIYNSLKDTEGKFKIDSPRILLAGHAVAVGDYVVPKIIEDTGAIIAAEMIDEGIRWYKWDVDTEGDLIRNIWRTKYLDKPPVNMFQPAWKDRFEYMKKLIEDCKIDAVVWYQLTFDEIYNMEYACIAKWLKEINIPVLKLESSYEYSREAMGPLNTRIESFIESVKGGK